MYTGKNLAYREQLDKIKLKKNVQKQLMCTVSWYELLLEMCVVVQNLNQTQTKTCSRILERETERNAAVRLRQSGSFGDTSVHVCLWVCEREGARGCAVTTSIKWKHIQSQTANKTIQTAKKKRSYQADALTHN